MAFEVRPCADKDEFRRAVDAIAQYFGPPLTEERVDRFSRVLEVDRMHAAVEDGTIVGGAGAFTFAFSVPGGSLPCAGVAVVGVFPTHRRRGVLRPMMDAQLLDVHERGEPIAALWASEEGIYGRFGYGLASWCGEISVPKEWNAFARPLERRGSTRLVTSEEARELFPPVHDAVRRGRPGMFPRPPGGGGLRTPPMPGGGGGAPKGFRPPELASTGQAHAPFRSHPRVGNEVS